MEINPPIKYPYLPEGRGIKYVEASNPFMIEAKTFMEAHSTDRLHKTGSVVVKDGKIIGYGANQSRLKSKKFFDLHMRGWCLRRKLKVASGTHYWLCPGCSPCSSHSEQRAVRDAIKNGHNTKGADLYLYGHWWCCKPCWDKMIKEGINNVYLLKGSETLFGR